MNPFLKLFKESSRQDSPAAPEQGRSAREHSWRLVESRWRVARPRSAALVQR